MPGPLTAVVDAQPGLAIYTLVVRNTGRSAASAFACASARAAPRSGRSRAGEQRAVAVLALACGAGEPIVVRVDADRRVEESVERGNATRRRCPLPLG